MYSFYLIRDAVNLTITEKRDWKCSHVRVFSIYDSKHRHCVYAHMLDTFLYNRKFNRPSSSLLVLVGSTNEVA